MARRRILYGLTLVAALLFQITNDNYLATFLLALALALPVLSLLLTLPAVVGCRLRLSPQPAAVPRGDPAVWLLQPDSHSPLPLPRLSLRLELKNLLTGQIDKKKLALNGLSRRAPVSYPADTAHCGLLELRVKKLRIYDYLGLFSFRLPIPEPARLITEPVPVDPGPLTLPEGAGIIPHSGTPSRKDNSEDYDLREYRPGDPLRSVHWKLSSKWDNLIVREPAETAVPLPLLTVDRFGSPEELDAVLDRLAGYCHGFLAVQRPHAVRWMDEKGQPVVTSISDKKELDACLLTILSTPAPARSPAACDSLLPAEDSLFRIHVSAGKEAGHD